MMPSFPRWCSAALLLFGLVGCGTTTRHGDAALHTRRAMIGPAGHRVWRLEFSDIRLTEQGRHAFRVRGMPRLAMYFQVWMDVPEAERGEQDITSAPWRDTILTVTVRTPAGAELGREAHRLGDLFARNGFGAGEYEDLPAITRAAPSGGDYDLEVRVDQPSPRRGDRLRVRARATTNDLY